MEHYNPYIKPRPFTSRTLQLPNSDFYISEIAFINTVIPILDKRVFYIEYVEGKNDKRGFYLDYNNYLSTIYFNSLKINKSITNLKPNGNIIQLSPATYYFSYIKIIKDIQNPQLEGQIMIFKFGLKIKQKIDEYFIQNKNQIFNNVFQIKVKYTDIYLNFDNCHFLEEKLTLTDNTLDLNNDIKYKVFMSKQIERKEKLKKINLNENLY